MVSTSHAARAVSTLRESLGRRVKFSHQVITEKNHPSHHYDVSIALPGRSIAMAVSFLAIRNKHVSHGGNTVSTH